MFYSDNGVLDSIKGGLIDFGGFTFNDNVTYKFSYINNEILVEHLAGTSTTSTYKIEEGKIISNNAPRPSSDEIKELLMKNI